MSLFRISRISMQCKRVSLFQMRGFARIMATDNVDPICVEIFKSRGHTVDVVNTKSEAELVYEVGNYDGLVVRSATKVTRAVLHAATKMRVIGRAGVGVDNIDVATATKCGIMVMNTPNGNTVSTAQLAVSLLCSMVRKIPQANMSVKEGKWTPKAFLGAELQGKTIGIVGCGRIGQVVASCAKTLGMDVVGFDPIMSVDDLDEIGIQKVSLEDIWAKCDFITVHTPLTADTKNILNDQTIAKCKRGVGIVNCARGGIVDEDALLRGLESGQVGVAAMDVFTSEPPQQHLHTLLQHPNFVCTPHLGASTDEAQINVARDIAVQMCDVFDQKDFVGIVNVPYMAASTQVHMKPFMALAEQLGSVVAQLSSSPIKTVELRSWGGRDVNITSKIARLLLEAKVLQGIEKYTDLDIDIIPDLISAPLIAKEANISSVVSTEPPENATSGNYRNFISVEVTRQNGQKNIISGSVFGSTPYIVGIDRRYDFFAFKPDSNFVLTFRNEDVPGSLVRALDLLYSTGVNIGNINIVRASTAAPDGTEDGHVSRALTFMSLDNDVPPMVMSKLKLLNEYQDVVKIQLI